MGRALRTTDNLAYEVAHILVEHGRDEAAALIAKKEKPPADGGTISQLIRHYYGKAEAERKAREAVEQERSWAEHIRMQEERQRKASK